jgi:hypothetical protein
LANRDERINLRVIAEASEISSISPRPLAAFTNPPD